MPDLIDALSFIHHRSSNIVEVEMGPWTLLPFVQLVVLQRWIARSYVLVFLHTCSNAGNGRPVVTQPQPIHSDLPFSFCSCSSCIFLSIFLWATWVSHDSGTSAS